MDLLKAVSIIGRDLEEAIALLDQLSSVPGSHIAETKLARSRVRSASDLVKLLPELAGTPVTQEAGKDVAGEIVSDTEAATADTSPQQSRPAVTVDKPVSQPEDDDAPRSPQQEEHVISVTGKATVKEPVKLSQETHKTQEPLKSILADRFSSAGTLGEKISSERQDEVVSSVIHSKPISDIAAAIGINDKFYFIRELFSGDTIAYNDTVRRLNSAASLGEAMKILDESTVMGSDPAAQSSFVDVVRRKFSIHV
jgi:hypothetical protein